MDEDNVSNDKPKIITLIALIVLVSILIVVCVFFVVVDLTHKEANNYLKTTRRNTTATTSSIVEPTEITEESTEVITEVTEEPTSSTTTPNVDQEEKSTTKKTTTKTTTRRTTTHHTTTTSVIPNEEYEIATGPTTKEDALDDWEWEIVNLVNAERRRKGLNELLVASYFRDVAEYAADLYHSNGESAVKDYIKDYAGLYMFSNLAVSPATLYNATLSSKVVSDPNLRYVGVGVIMKNTGLDTYYYVIIYE